MLIRTPRVMTDFDPSDPYDAASAWCCFFICDTCSADLEFTSDHQPGLNYYHEQGQRAKADGWYVADESTNTDPRYVLRCSRCARAAGLTLPPRDLRVRPNGSVLTCGLTARPGELPGA
jgi:hypothetical protein